MSRSLENAQETAAAVIGSYAAAHARGAGDGWGGGASVGNIHGIPLSVLIIKFKKKKNPKT